jgi:Xaa-Pro aminopeptidase
MEWIMPIGTYLQLKGSLPGVQFVSADELMDRIRMVKSPLEIKQIHEVYKLVRASMERFIEVLKPGKTQVEVVTEALQVALEGGAVSVQARVGEKSGLDVPRNVPIKGDDVVRFYPTVIGDSGHMNEQMLVCIFREPTDFESKLLESEIQAYKEARKMAKPGVRLSDMTRVLERVLKEDGWEWGAPRTGYDYHGIGMSGVERPCYAEVMDNDPEFWYANQDWKLEEGVVINYHPRKNYTAVEGEVTELAGTGINEDILITKNGAERLLGEDWDRNWRIMG